MRTLVIAFVLGAVAVAIAGSVAGLALGISAQSGDWGSFRIALGPLLFISYERLPNGTSTSFGNGLILIAFAGGALNAIGAGILARRASP